MQSLDKTTTEEISAFLLNPPAIGKLDALKTLLISTFGLTQADKDASLLAISGLGDLQTIRPPQIYELSHYN